MTFQEHVPLRNDHSRTTGTTETPAVSTTSSDSIVPGPGYLGAKFLKWVGNTSLDSIEELVIRRRLVVIKQAVRNKSHIFIEALSSEEVHEVDRIHGDLRELCSVNYPSNIRRRAARIVLEIAFIVHSKQGASSAPGLAGWAAPIRDPWDRWSMLLKLSTTMSYSLLDGNDGGFADASVESAFTSRGTHKTSNTTDTRRTIQIIGGNVWTDAVTRRKLARIKRTVRKRPQIFTSTQGLQQVHEVDEIYTDLVLMMRGHSLPARRRAASVVLEIAVVIYGPSDILSPTILLDNNETATSPQSIWFHLVTRSDVHSLLTAPPASSSFVSRLRKARS